MRLRTISMMIGIMIVSWLRSQDFQLQNQALEALGNSAISWADFDGDKDLDLLIAGETSQGTLRTLLYRNNDGVFENSGVELPGMKNPSMVWGDYDNDGDLDLLLAGQNAANKSFLFNNDAGTFEVALEMPYLGERGEVLFMDADNDGDLDIFAFGNWTSLWYQNNGNDNFELHTNNFPVFNAVQADAGDYDNDGDNDIIISGDTGSGLRVFILKNDLDSIEIVQTYLPGMIGGCLRLGDYDNDGDLDIFNMGNNSSMDPQADIFKNAGDDNFVNINAGITSVYLGKAAWGDYDNDGDLDIMTIGHLAGCGVAYGTFIYENIGNDWFNSQDISFTKGENAALAWGDYDNDGDLDVAIAGVAAESDYFTEIYKNNLAFPGESPGIPEGLSATFVNSQVLLQWNASEDTQTPSEGLSYNVYIGTQPGKGDIMSSQNIGNFLMKPAFGNAGEDTTLLIKGLQNGVTYYWSVQAVDNSFTASDFAPEASFTVDYSAVKEEASPDFSIYPNPVKSVITYHLQSAPKIYGGNIIDMQGNIQKSFTGNKRKIDISGLPAGTYGLQIKTVNRSYYHIFIKE